MAQTHYYPEDEVHYIWDNELDPALTIAPATRSSTTPARSATARSRPTPPPMLATLDWDRLYPLAGPVAIEGGARRRPGGGGHRHPHQGWGWTAVIPGFGLLEEDFTEPYSRSSTSPPVTTRISRTTSLSP